MTWKFKQNPIITSPSTRFCTIDLIAERLSKEFGLELNKAHIISQEILVKVFKERKLKLNEVITKFDISDDILIKLFSIASELDEEFRDFIIKNKINLNDKNSLKFLKDLL